jgi:hypothetical protein
LARITRFEPGNPDQGQPTFFETGTPVGRVRDQGAEGLRREGDPWTLDSNGETQSVPFTLNKGYPITPFKELGMGNQPPTLWFAADGTKVMGPPTSVAGSFSGAVRQPVRSRCSRTM